MEAYMKKRMTIVFLSFLILSGCSLLGEVNSSLEYADNATEYINTVKDCANEVPALAQDAVTNAEARENLEKELQLMKTEIEDFNATEPPQIAEGIHEKIVSSNQQLSDGIELYLNNIESGQIDPKALEDSEVMKSIDNLTELAKQIEELGN
jgi:PBP1b-binding outer membrane lipoprotein LpoB